MKQLLSILCLGALVALSFNFFSIEQGGDDLPSVSSYYDGPLFSRHSDTGVSCSSDPAGTTGIFRDDGTFENGYRSTSTGDSTTMVHKMILDVNKTIRAVCVAWTALSPSGNITYNIVVYDTLGTAGAPGNLVARLNGQTGTGVAIFPGHSRYRSVVNFGPLPNRSYYIGVQWDNDPILPFFSSVDENGTSTMGPGYQRLTTTFPPFWNDLSVPFPNWDNFSYRVEVTSAPTLPPYGCQDVTTYVPITGTAGPVGDDAIMTVPLNFTFNYMGTPYTQVTIATNGYAVLGTSTFNAFDGNVCQTIVGSFPLLAPFYADLNQAVGTGNIQWTTIGTAPNRLFVCQWTNVGYFGGTASQNITMQLRLSETSDCINFIYGPCTPGPQTGTIGINVSPGGSGNFINVRPGGTCGATTTSTTSCLPTAFIMSVGRKFVFGIPCVLIGINNQTGTIPNQYTLSQNYPNPFNPSTIITYGLPKSSNVELKIYDILGREVKTLVNEFKQSGTYDITFDASNFASGLYFYTLKSGDFTETKKMLMVK